MPRHVTFCHFSLIPFSHQTPFTASKALSLLSPFSFCKPLLLSCLSNPITLHTSLLFSSPLNLQTMGRGKIEIKRIENTTNRQVTYSKRRTGIVKKARELTVLCDAEVSLIMFSSTGKLSEYISPCTTTKKIYDQYQQITGTNLWNSHYEKMQETLKKQKDVNLKLRKEIRHRIGESLDDLSFEELRGLEQDLDGSLKVVRDRKYHMIGTQTETYRKKIRNLQETHTHLVREFEIRGEEAYYEGDYEALLGLSHGAGHLLPYRLQPTQPSLHHLINLNNGNMGN